MTPLLYPIIHKLRQRFFGERDRRGRALGTGLLRGEDDDRDYKLGIFGWGEYKPLHTRYEIPVKWVKNQRNFNTCVMNSATAQKEADEKVELSVRGLVTIARREGYVQGNGYSALRDIQKCVQKFGIPEARLLPEADVDWEAYSDVNLLTPAVLANAALHKSKSYFTTKDRNETLKMLDEGRILHTGMAWYQGFNMGGGFSWPWLISMIKGFLVGGHAFDIIGYDFDYQGNKVYKLLNSYSTGWGDKGYFYAEMDFLDKVGYERYVQVDMPPEVAAVIASYQGQFVKAPGSPAIYFVTQGKRHLFPDMDTFLAFGGRSKGYTEIPAVALDAIPDDSVMDITQSDYWPYIKDLDKSQWRDALILLISKR